MVLPASVTTTAGGGCFLVVSQTNSYHVRALAQGNRTVRMLSTVGC